MTTPWRDDAGAPVIPEHEVFRCIGEGSYGRVWLARTVLGSWRAVKVVRRDLFQDAVSYEREYSGLRRFEPLSRSHAGLVGILQCGEEAGGGGFHYVMELADDASGAGTAGSGVGEVADPARYRPLTLSERLRREGRLGVEECVRIGAILADALARLHGAGLIHRDVKPSNIVFVGGEPKLADIGLVIEVSEARTFVGTEGYVAPEGPNSTQADLYSLGMVLYEASMGMDRRSFPSPGPAMRADGPEAMRLCELNAVLVRACACRREERHGTAEALAAELRLLGEGGSVQGLRRRERMRRGGVMVAGAMALALALTGLGLGFWKGWASRRAEVEVARARQHAAMGARSMMGNDLGGAALHFAESLTGWVEGSREVELQRIRLRQVLRHSARPLVTMDTGSAVSSVAFSPDGRWLVTGDDRGVVCLWESSTGRLQGRFEGMGGAVEVRFTEDGRWVWAVPTSVDLRHEAEPARRAVRLDAADLGVDGVDVRQVSLACGSSDGQVLAVVGPAGTMEARLIDARTGEVRHVLRGHRSRIAAMTLSPDGTCLATGGSGIDKSIRAWNTADGTPLGQAWPCLEAVVRLHFRPGTCDELVATMSGKAGCVVSLLGVERPGSERRVAQSSGFLSVGGLPALNGRRFLVSDELHGVSVRSFGDGERVLQPLRLPGGQCVGACMGPDGVTAAVGSDDGWVGVWDLGNGAPLIPAFQVGGRVRALGLAPDAGRLVTGSQTGAVRIWDLKSRQGDTDPVCLEGATLGVPHPRFPYPAAWVGGDSLAAITEVDGVATAQVVEVRTGQMTTLGGVPGLLPSGAMVAAHQAPAWASFNLLMGGEAGWNDVMLAAQGESGWGAVRLPHPYPPGAVGFTPDDTWLVTIDREARVRVWGTSDGRMEREVALLGPGFEGMVLAPRLSTGAGYAAWMERPDRSTLSHARWNVPNPEVRRRPFRLAIKVYELHPREPLVALVTADRRLHVLDVVRDVELTVPLVEGVPVLATSLSWSPTLRRLLVESDNGRLVLVDLDRSLAIVVPTPEGHDLSAGCGFSPDGGWLLGVTMEGRAWVADAVAGDPVTPWVAHPEPVRFAVVGKGGGWVTLDGKGTVRSWNLTPAVGSAASLREQARLVSGRRMVGGTPEWESAAALAAMRPESRAAGSAMESWDWHLDRARTANSIPRLEFARFHARHVSPAAKGDGDVRAREWARLEGMGIRERDESLPGSALDLGAFYTHGLDMVVRRPFERLPRGHVVLGGVTFDVRGMVRLEAVEYGPLLRGEGEVLHDSFPVRTVAGIPVGRPCRRLHFLHGVDGPFRGGGEECARWRVRFVDGSQRVIPVAWGEQGGGALAWRSSEGAPLRLAQVVWTGRGGVGGASPPASLALVTWENPDPRHAIDSLDFTLGSGRSRPFVVAITAE